MDKQDKKQEDKPPKYKGWMKQTPHNRLSEQSVVVKSKKHTDKAVVRRHPLSKYKLLKFKTYAVRTLYDNFQHAVSKYPDNPCLGTREMKHVEEAPKGESQQVAGPYKWMSYNEVEDLAVRIGTVLVKEFKISPSKNNDNPSLLVGLYSKNRAEWIITEQACNMHSLVTVALYDTFGPENLQYVINHAALPVVFGSLDRIQNILKVVKKCPGLKFLVSFDDIPDNAREDMISQAKALNGITLFSWNELLEKVKNGPLEEPTPPKASSLAIIMYTSGTTGEPKGVMITHANMVAATTGALEAIGGLRPDDVYLSYLPLAHIFERCCISGIIGYGLKIGFYQGDVKQFSSDVAELKPTLLAGVPRIFDLVQDGILAVVNSSGNLKRKIFDTAFKSKEKGLAHGESASIWDSIIFNKLKDGVGGKLRFIISGGAPLPADTHKFVSVCFGCPVVQGYGLTETCAIGCIQNYADSFVFGEVGPPVRTCEIKLVDIPEMNYMSTSDPPAGEVWIRGPNVSQGYYKQPEKTKEDFDSDGWFHTGDVGTWTDRGTLKIIDRKKNIFKLAQGEYVPAEVLEGYYKGCHYLSQIWIHGESTERAIVAVGTLQPLSLSKLAAQVGESEVEGDSEDEKVSAEALANNPKVNKLVLDELNAIAKSKNLLPYECIRALHLTATEFSPENDYLTPTMKLKRVQLKKGFEKEIKALYEVIHEWENTQKDKEKGEKKKGEKAEKVGDKGGEKKPTSLAEKKDDE